jgi:pre-mRNA-splicing factor ATP-dependent RNA helicase DHX16
MASSPPSPALDDPADNSSSSHDEESNVRCESDLRERDAFAKRLRQRDDEKTKKKFKTESTTQASDRSALSIDELRKKSRRVYLASRKDKKMQELEDELADEKYIFGDETLTDRERQEIEFKQRALRLAREHEKAQQLENIDRYHMPNAKSDETSKNDRYREDYRHSDAKNTGHNFEQRKWEEDMIHTALPHFGSLDKDKKSQQKTYEYILDEEIQFVQQLTIPGVNEILQHKEKSKSNDVGDGRKLKHRSIQESRKTLPIYKFREDLIHAIREHQVLIIEGETGSGKTSRTIVMNDKHHRANISIEQFRKTYLLYCRLIYSSAIDTISVRRRIL